MFGCDALFQKMERLTRATDPKSQRLHILPVASLHICLSKGARVGEREEGENEQRSHVRCAVCGRASDPPRPTQAFLGAHHVVFHPVATWPSRLNHKLVQFTNLSFLPSLLLSIQRPISPSTSLPATQRKSKTEWNPFRPDDE